MVRGGGGEAVESRPRGAVLRWEGGGHVWFVGFEVGGRVLVGWGAAAAAAEAEGKEG